jgi:hypothetical protein
LNSFPVKNRAFDFFQYNSITFAENKKFIIFFNEIFKYLRYGEFQIPGNCNEIHVVSPSGKMPVCKNEKARRFLLLKIIIKFRISNYLVPIRKISVLSSRLTGKCRSNCLLLFKKSPARFEVTSDAGMLGTDRKGLFVSGKSRG